MSDRMNDVLAAIDAETAKCICGTVVPTDGASLDYCSPECQYGYAGPRGSYRLGHGLPDGRTLNEQVAHALTRSEPSGEHYADAMRQPAPTEPGEGHTIGTQPVGGGETRVMWVPNIADPNAPTRAELDAGMILGVLDENGQVRTERPPLLENVRQWDRAWDRAWEQATAPLTVESLNQALQDLYEMGGHVDGPIPSSAPEPPLTGEAFRRRALEHQQNRGTGPDERRQRQPRHHGPRRTQ